MIKADSLKMPEKLDGWKLEGPPQKITRETIFDYMDGGGELYLAYKFSQLLVYKYSDGHNNEILVEIYEMLHPDEAFGLLSLDWTGEPVVLNPELSKLPENPAAPNITALYGEGLLRARLDNLYLRVLAERESAGIKEVILQIGKSVAAQSRQPALPEILSFVQPDPEGRWRIKKDRTSYFHSHLLLNSLYYLSHENILHLSHDCEGLYTEWAEAVTDTRRTARLFLLRYPEASLSRQALSDFLQVYVSEKSPGGSDSENSEFKPEGLVQLEDGWLAWKLTGSCLALIFEAPGPEAVKEILNQIRWK
ncbi:MAG: hypothetical protein QME85_10245 [Candidatus Saccharicenans sp.]|nr:hypothetical protein [Candidatus Saccharicenans sp.]